MSIKNIAIQCGSVAGVALLVNIPIGIFLFSSVMDRMVFYATSALHIYCDEAIGDFLVNAAFFLSLLVAILVVLTATRFVQWWCKWRRSNLKWRIHQDQFFPQIPFISLWITRARLTQVVEPVEISPAARHKSHQQRKRRSATLRRQKTRSLPLKHQGITNVFTSVNSPGLRIGTRIVSLFSFGVFSFVMIVTCATVISVPLFPLP
jgi:hypothetical protein